MDSQESSDSESDLIPNRRPRKRAISSSSESSSCSTIIGARRLISQRKRFRGQLNLNDSDSDDETPRTVILETSNSEPDSASDSSEHRSPSMRPHFNPMPFIFAYARAQVQEALAGSSPQVNEYPSGVRTAASERVLRPTFAALSRMTDEPVACGSRSPIVDDSESSDDGTMEKCAICLRSIRLQEVGTPEGCDHTFCLACIEQWAKNCNKCPMDRQPFKIILVRDNLQGEVVRQLPVEEQTLDVNVEDTIFCLICGGFDRDERMLLCDGCDRGFHLDCLNPPLAEVPEVDEWFCPTCAAWNQVSTEVRGRGRTASPLRTRVRVETRSTRIFINQLFDFNAAISQQSSSSTSRLGTSLSPEEQPGSSGTQRTAPTPVRRRRTRHVKRKKRKSILSTIRKKISISNRHGTVREKITYSQRLSRGRKKVKRKKRRRAAASTATRPESSTRDRLSSTLVCRSMRVTPAIGANVSRSSARLPVLHIFGPRDELAPVSSGSDGEGIVGTGDIGLVSRPRVVGHSMRPIERRKAVELLQTPSRPRPAPEPCQGPSDLLSSILESQSIWHSKNTNVTFGADGSVEICPRALLDVRNGTLERAATAAPVSPGAQSGSLARPPATNVSNTSGPSATVTSPAAAASSASRTGGDREGYTSFFNNISSQGPTPFCRGGPPLRFRMPIRPQLRRIPLLPRRAQRHLYDNESEELDLVDEEDEKTEMDSTSTQPDEDIDIYSDIEPSVAEKEEDNCDGTQPEPSFPALGPPPEPPQFLLNFSMSNENNESEVYDPAEPCDSEEEMVIDESKVQAIEDAATPENLIVTHSPPPTPPIDATEDCPVFRLYSSDSVAYSRKGEEERARELEENKLKRQKTPEEDEEIISPPPSPKERPGARLSFNVESPSVDDSQDSVAAVAENVEEPKRPTSNASANLPMSPGSDKRRSRRRSGCSRNDSRSPVSEQGSRTRKISNRSSVSPDLESPSKARSRSRKSSDARSTSPKNRRESINLLSSSPLNLSSSPRDVQRVSTGLEGLDVEEVSSDMEENDFNADDNHLSSLSLSGLSDRSRRSPTISKKKKRKKKRIKEKSKKCASEEGELDSDRDKAQKSQKTDGVVGDENKSDSDKKKRNRSKSVSADRQILGSKENRKPSKGDKDFSWKKPSKKDKNYREGRKTSKERAKSKERRASKSPSPKRGKKKPKDRKKSDKEKKKEIERYDVRKIVKNKKIRKKDAFGRDLPSQSLSLSRSPSKSKSRSKSRSRSRGPVRGRRASRSPSPSPARGNRRGRRRFRSPARSPSPRRNKKRKSPERIDVVKANRSRPRISRSRRRSPSRSPLPPRPNRGNRANKKDARVRKSWSRSLSLSSAHRSPSPPRMRSDFIPSRVRRSISPVVIRHSRSRSWSRGISVGRDPSVENLTVVVTAKDKKKKKKRKDGKRLKTIESRKKKGGNSKEVFASGDNVLVSVNFNRTSRNNNIIPLVVPDVSPIREVSKKKRRVNVQDGRPTKKSKTSNSVSKTVVDAALSQTSTKRKKLTRLNEADAQEILNRKPVAVIDLDISPYREQTPSPINVVVVSDSGSGEEGKAATPPRRQSPEIIVLQQPPPATNAQFTSGGPKTPPEPPLKFSISKPAQLRPIVNPLAEPEEDENEDSPEGADENASSENQHKGPNTPPEPRGPSTPPRGPSTPKTPPSPQTSPDAYDPFEPTKSRSPSPLPAQSSGPADSVLTVDTSELNNVPAAKVSVEDNAKTIEIVDVSNEDVRIIESENACETIVAKDGDKSDASPIVNKSTTVGKKATIQTITPNTGSTLPLFSLPSPNKTTNRQQNIMAASGIQRLQHRLGSPVNKTPNSIKMTPEKRGPETGNFKTRNMVKRNGPLQDATNETVEMDDSPYSPASCEGDDLFDPPPSAPVTYKPKSTGQVKAQNKFDLLFGVSAPTLSPMKNGAKKMPKANKAGQKGLGAKGPKKVGGKKGVSLKMDEDQLRILDEVPSSAVELQVKDKFLKKLNRQERVVDEVKTVLKPHYARKHVTKDEYKDILRRAVPKICHSKSGEINPSKIQHLIEAYVRKCRHNKKKGTGGVQKPKLKKTTMFS